MQATEYFETHCIHFTGWSPPPESTKKMIRVRTLIVFALLASTQMIWTPSADAGPLMDWIQRRRAARQARVCPQPCATCTTTCQQTCQRVVVNYVPYTAYRASWERIPVTTYRQTTSTDPCTGCKVTCNRPCTTYTWRMKQVPFTTYRAVYRTETYQVPVTYTTVIPAATAPTCNTCAPTVVQSVAAPACSTCAIPYANQIPAGTAIGGTTYSPYYQSTPTPATGTTQPADTIPSLTNPQQMQKPVLEGSTSNTNWPSTNVQTNSTGQYIPIPDPNPSARWNNNSAPQLLDPFNKSARAPSVKSWDYSPVKLASYQTPVESQTAGQQAESNEYVGSWSVSPGHPQGGIRVNDGWRKD